jgi:hypothetical protein
VRFWPGFCVAFLLALLLIGTTPIGTGLGVHQFDLIHPLFTHTHLVNGQVLTHEQVAQQSSGSNGPNGPAIGAGSAAGVAELGLALGPTLPLGAVWTGAPPRSAAQTTDEPRLPTGRTVAPPDPPPTFRA